MERDFKGVWIPKEIWLNKELTLQEKVMLVEIDSLDNEDGCFASNKYFADFFELSITRISHVISNLVNKGWLDVAYEKNGKQIIRRIMKIKRPPYPTCDTYCVNSKGGIADTQGGYCENSKDNNTSINNINKSNKKKYIKEKYGTYGRVKLTIDEYLRLVNEFGEDFIKQQIDLLDEYIESNNNKNKYTNFNLVLRRAIRENWFKGKERTTKDLKMDLGDFIKKGERK